MRKKTRKEAKTSLSPAAAANLKPLRVVPVLTVSTDTPIYYVNHAEVSRSTHEFVVALARLPSRVTPEQRAELESGGVLRSEALLQLILPPTLVPGLIQALQAQLDLHRKQDDEAKAQEAKNEQH